MALFPEIDLMPPVVELIPVLETLIDSFAKVIPPCTSKAAPLEIEVVPANANPTGVGTFYSGALQSYTTTTTTAGTSLLPSTEYKYYIRVVCANSSSAWMEGTFTTLSAALPIPSPTIPPPKST